MLEVSSCSSVLKGGLFPKEIIPAKIKKHGYSRILAIKGTKLQSFHYEMHPGKPKIQFVLDIFSKDHADYEENFKE